MESGDCVRVGIRKHVTHVKRTRHRWWWRVDGEHVGSLRRSIEGVDALLVPYRGPLLFNSVEAWFLRDVRHEYQG